MASSFARGNPAVPGPSRAWALGTLTLFGLLATLSVVQGVVDVTLPAARGEAPFAFLAMQSEARGPWFYFAYVLAHNLGLACIVPGYGFLAAWVERRPLRRWAIAALLLGGVASGLAMTLAALLHAAERFNLRVAIPLYVGEAVSILVLAALAARELPRFDPARTGWGGVLALRWPLAVSASLLGLLAAVETVFVFTAR